MADLEKVVIPDLGGADDVTVIEILVNVGDRIKVEDSIVTLEGDKASMDVPSTATGVVKEISLKVGDKVKAGSLILTVAKEGAASSKEEKSEKKSQKEQQAPEKVKEESASDEDKIKSAEEEKKSSKEETKLETGGAHAGPAVRRIAKELDINLSSITGTGEKSRITKEDLKRFVKGSAGGFTFPAAPKVDFSKFGETEIQPLSKIKKLSGANLARNWVSIPHVTQFEEADITEMEAFRQEQKDMAKKQGVRLTPLVFIMKAVVAALKEYPIFNASLDSSGENLILKKYFNVGVAVDTPNGLVVPVIRNVDRKTLFELAKELGDISEKAREKGLSLADMQGGCFTISSLGGIGGTAFTPIINAPEVAILGVSRSFQKPVYQAYGEFVPRLMLPLSLSYDHRVIDGAQAAHFIVYLASRMADIRTLLL